MKPDIGRPREMVGHHERAHLREPGDRSHRMWWYAPSPQLAELVDRYWIPVWSLPDGEVAEQRVLRYPVALVVIGDAYAHFSGTESALSSVSLEGRGYVVGVRLRPAAGALIAGGSMSHWTDRTGELREVLGDAAGPLVAAVRAAMGEVPGDPTSHRAAIAAYESALERFVPIDDEGRLVNEIVDLIETDSGILRVAQVCERFDIGERALQRLVHRRLGISPKWIIRRRRLHEATEALRLGDDGISAIAARLGYADQAHFTRDLRSITDLTPARLARTYAPDRPPLAETVRLLAVGEER